MATFPIAPRTPLRGALLLIFMALIGGILPGCSSADESGSPLAEPPSATESPEGAPPFLEQRFQRNFVFVSRDAGTPVVVVWTFRQSVVAEGIRRVRMVHLGWEGQWETLIDDERMTPHNRFPWRMLPGSGIRIQLGTGEQVRQLIIDLPTRQLEVTRLAPVGDWSPEPSLNLQIHRGQLSLPTGPLDGFLVESTWNGPRSLVAGPREWAILVTASGRPFLLLQEDENHAAEGEPARWVAWSPSARGDALWPGVEVRWTEVTPIERARRNAPTGWQLASEPAVASSFLEGSLETRSFRVDVLPGSGPVFPIRGLYWVQGTLRSQDSPRGLQEPAHGFLHHRQPLIDAP